MDSDNQVICPVCKQIVLDFDEGENDPCEHVMLMYTDSLNDEFVYIDDEAEDIAEEMIAQYEDSDGDDMLDVLITNYANEHEDYEIVELTTSGMSCGPCGNTDYVLFKVK